jgi:hypothetical protein
VSSTTVGSNYDIQPELTLASNNGMDTTVNELIDSAAEAMDQPLHKVMEPSIDASLCFESHPLIAIPPAAIASHLEFTAEDAAAIAAAPSCLVAVKNILYVLRLFAVQYVNTNSIGFLTD